MPEFPVEAALKVWGLHIGQGTSEAIQKGVCAMPSLSCPPAYKVLLFQTTKGDLHTSLGPRDNTQDKAPLTHDPFLDSPSLNGPS